MSEPNYTLFCVSNRVPAEDYYCYDAFMKSTEGMNKLMVAGIGTHYVGLCDKAKFLYRAIKYGHISTKYVIVSDVWDLVFCCQPEEIILRFLEQDCDVWVSAEKNCFPADYKDEYDKLPSPTEFKYLNSGMIVAYTDKMLELLEEMKIEEIPTDYHDAEKGCNVHFVDQTEYGKAFLRQPVKMKLDYEQKLSRTLHNATLDELDFSEERIRNISTNSSPCTIHFNGNGKSENNLRATILEHLNLL